jgi:tRNA U54 and U55 pseudouridine synthase Pus10
MLINVCKSLVRKFGAKKKKQCGNFERGRMLKIDVHVIVYRNFIHSSQKTQSVVLYKTK